MATRAAARSVQHSADKQALQPTWTVPLAADSREYAQSWQTDLISEDEPEQLHSLV